jgi:superfamily II DNA/RNA helicase
MAKDFDPRRILRKISNSLTRVCFERAGVVEARGCAGAGDEPDRVGGGCGQEADGRRAARRDLIDLQVTARVARVRAGNVFRAVAHAVAVGIRHAVYPVPRHLKTELLIELLRGDGLNSVIVFTRTKHMADRLGTQLIRRGIRTSILHGDRSQNQRTHAMEAFRAGRTQVMVATDIAARGIDISDITHVINYSQPQTYDDYIHRIGRAGRAGQVGHALTFVIGS